MSDLLARLRPIRGTVVAALMLVALLALVVVGRWERSRNDRVQNTRMAAVFHRATSEGLVSKRLDLYRLADTFDCLDYRPPEQPKAKAAFELCFDREGRLVQTVERLTYPPRYASLLESPSAATLSVPVPRLLAAFAAVGAFRDPRFAGVTRNSSTLPVGFSDIGAVSIPKPRPKKT